MYDEQEFDDPLNFSPDLRRKWSKNINLRRK
jgi:hypothetical protein